MHKFLLLFLVFTSGLLLARDPQLCIPKISSPPVIDGRLSPGEWDRAGSISMFGFYNHKGLYSAEQPLFYLSWDQNNLYIAMDCRENGANSVVSRTTRNDFISIIGDDCVEIMLAPGTGKEVFDADFLTYYLALNSTGAVWDARFKPQRNECHNTWQSGIEAKSSVSGSRWVLETRIPLKNIDNRPVSSGTRWRINLCRTFFAYQWIALNPRGALNDARIGADLLFTESKPVVRLIGTESLNSGKLRTDFELFNPSPDKSCTITMEYRAECREIAGSKDYRLHRGDVRINLKPGEKQGLVLGKGEHLSWNNLVTIQALDSQKTPLLYLERKVDLPPQRLNRQLAPETPPVAAEVLFMPSQEKLDVRFDITSWLERTTLPKGNFSAAIKILKKGEKTPLVEQTFDAFNSGKGTWSYPTPDLPEGDYVVDIQVTSYGKKALSHSDWFEKRIFPWMKKSPLPNTVPEPYLPLETTGTSLKLWGRQYDFAPNGFPARMITQGKNYMTGTPELILVKDGQKTPLKVTDAFRFTEKTPRKVTGKAVLSGGGIKLTVTAKAEYDGFILYNVTCESSWFARTVEHLQLKLALNGKLARFLSASGDTSGVNLIGRVLPQKDGPVYDSITDTRCVVMTPSFSTLFWLGDHDVSFCYAADSDKGWVLRPDQPALKAVRQGGVIYLDINLIDRPVTLKEAQTMEFAFQTGPTKPRPENWRSFADATNTPPGAPGIPNYRVQIGGDGFTTHGGSHSLHPGLTPEMRRKSHDKIVRLEKQCPPGQVHVVGYQYWGHTVKGFPEARVFRGEWGLSGEAWNSNGTFNQWAWNNKFFGENRDNYTRIRVTPCPSYVDFLTYAYDETLKTAHLYGFYDDTGYPKPLYLPHFGLGYRKDGKEFYSSGLWLYRKRWKSIAEIQAKNKRLNLTGDSQHMHAHLMPAYAFIGVYAPCEQGFYNPFPEKDAYEYYGSLDEYAARTPAKQFGQIPLIGLESTRTDLAAFIQDTRAMFMITALNDHSLGCFGRREQFTIDRLTAARAMFRPWEKSTSFTGYWESNGLCALSDPNIRMACYRRPGQAMLLLGNTGNRNSAFTLAPSWKALGLNPARTVFYNAETQEPLALKDGKLNLTVSRHDLLMVMAAPEGTFQLYPRLNWERFLGKEAPRTWTPHSAAGTNGLAKVYGRNFLYGHHGGFMQVTTPLPKKDSLEISFLCSDGLSAGLVWGTKMLKITPTNGILRCEFEGTQESFSRNLQLPETETGWYPFRFAALRLKITPEKITVQTSVDAATWTDAGTLNRPADFLSQPEELLFGWGHQGPNPLLRNLMKYYNPTPRYPNIKIFSHVNIK